LTKNKKAIYKQTTGPTGPSLSSQTANGLTPGTAVWPEKTKSALVIAVEHKASQPEMDLSCGRKSPTGNRVL